MNLAIAYRASVAQKAQRRNTRIASLPAPVGGWNARDSIANMEETDAVTMQNWFPKTSDVALREGYTEFATGIPGQVESLMPYAGPTASKLFAAAGAQIYDVTSGGAVGTASVVGLSNARWQHVNVSTSGGNFMLCVNGADKLRGYTGSAWYADGDGTHDITGIDTSTIVNINLFKNRVWLIPKNSLNAYYLGTNAISGAATAFPLYGIARKGGYLVAMGTWTIDAGDGVDDYAVFITSEGEVIVYQGTDPANANTWAMRGVWELGQPIGSRCFLKFRGDLALICTDGVVPLSGALQSSRVNPRVALTDKIQGAMNTATQLYAANFGWQLCFWPEGSHLFLNVPIVEGAAQEQYVMNTITGAWGNYTGLAANCWAVYEDDPYFGGNGIVGKFGGSVYQDNGSAITGTVQQAFSYFKSRGQKKRFTLARPTLRTNGIPQIKIALNVDFNTATPSSGAATTTPPVGLWGVGLWGVATWGAGEQVVADWQTVGAVGYAGGIALQSTGDGIKISWASTDFKFEYSQGNL